MSILEGLAEESISESPDVSMDTDLSTKKVALVDAMAVVQSMGKPDTIKNCCDLASHFSGTVKNEFHGYDEARLIFDRYDVPMSLKTAPRVTRQHGQPTVYYDITDSTIIAKLPLRKLLAHTKTKMELTKYLAKKVC